VNGCFFSEHSVVILSKNSSITKKQTNKQMWVIAIPPHGGNYVGVVGLDNLRPYPDIDKL